MKEKGDNKTTLSVYPETNKDLDDIIEATKNRHPKTNKKEIIYFLVKQYKQEVESRNGEYATETVTERVQEAQITR